MASDSLKYILARFSTPIFSNDFCPKKPNYLYLELEKDQINVILHSWDDWEECWAYPILNADNVKIECLRIFHYFDLPYDLRKNILEIALFSQIRDQILFDLITDHVHDFINQFIEEEEALENNDSIDSMEEFWDEFEDEPDAWIDEF